eukprot:2273159-Pyramimonas_sp.AAC.2
MGVRTIVRRKAALSKERMVPAISTKSGTTLRAPSGDATLVTLITTPSSAAHPPTPLSTEQPSQHWRVRAVCLFVYLGRVV